MEKKIIWLSLFADNMCLCGENFKISPKCLLELISEFSKVVGYKVHTQNLIILLYTKNDNWKPKLKPWYNL